MSGEESEESRLECSTYQRLLIASSVAFLILPFITTFNEFLTKIVENIGLYMFIQTLIAPTLVRMIGAVLQYFFGIQTSVSSTSLYLQGPWLPLRIYISWNCIGWQSLVLFLFTLATGLQGPYTVKSKVKCLIMGIEGTFLINLLRIVLPCLLAFYWGYLPAIVFHDYFGTLLTIAWLGIFWYFSFEYVLERKTDRDQATRKTNMICRLNSLLKRLCAYLAGVRHASIREKKVKALEKGD